MPINDGQWDRIKDLLPGQAGQPGDIAKDNRLFVDAVLYRYRAGIPWRGICLPVSATFASCTPVRTIAAGWQRVFEALAQEADNEYATIVRAHQHSAGAKEGILTNRPSDAAEAA